MKLENQVTSLELAKHLKDLGVKQDSIFYFANLHKKSDMTLVEEAVPVYKDILVRGMVPEDEWLSAFTVAELGKIFQDKFEPFMQSIEFGYNCCEFYTICEFGEDLTDERKDIPERMVMSDENEANSRAKMLVYLIENKLITL